MQSVGDGCAVGVLFRKKKRPTKDFASLALLVVVFWSPFSISLLVVADVTHDPPDETLAVLETPGVEDAFSRAKKKPCLDDRDTDSPLDKDRDTMPGPEERSSRPGQ